jgi:hypothetical protein
MHTIVAGQRLVTAGEFIEAASGFDFRPEMPEFIASGAEDLAAQRAALADLIEDLGEVAESEDDRLDLAHYRGVLRRLPSPFRRTPAASALIGGLPRMGKASAAATILRAVAA